MLFLSNLRLMTVTTAMVKPDWLISITDPGTVVPRPEGVSAERHRTLRFHDLTQPVVGTDIILPDRMAARSVFDMLLDIPADKSVLIHCLAGISRSPAVVLAIVHHRWPDALKETSIALRHAAPWVVPNPFLIQSLDKELGGTVISDALAGMGGPRMRGCMSAVELGPRTARRL